MAFCQNCGQPIPENANHCPACGAAVFNPQQPAPQQEPQQPAPQNSYQQPQQAPQQPAALLDPDVAANKGIAWLSYLGIFLLIPLFARKTSEYCKHHVKQGAILWLVELAYTTVTQILLGIIYLIAPPVITWFGYRNSVAYTIFYWIFMIGDLFLLAVAIIGIVAAATGKKDKLFVLSKIPFLEKLVGPVVDMTYDVLNKQK